MQLKEQLAVQAVVAGIEEFECDVICCCVDEMEEGLRKVRVDREGRRKARRKREERKEWRERMMEGRGAGGAPGDCDFPAVGIEVMSESLRNVASVDGCVSSHTHNLRRAFMGQNRATESEHIIGGACQPVVDADRGPGANLPNGQCLLPPGAQGGGCAGENGAVNVRAGSPVVDFLLVNCVGKLSELHCQRRRRGDASPLDAFLSVSGESLSLSSL